MEYLIKLKRAGELQPSEFERLIYICQQLVSLVLIYEKNSGNINKLKEIEILLDNLSKKRS